MTLSLPSSMGPSIQPQMIYDEYVRHLHTTHTSRRTPPHSPPQRKKNNLEFYRLKNRLTKEQVLFFETWLTMVFDEAVHISSAGGESNVFFFGFRPGKVVK